MFKIYTSATMPTVRCHVFVWQVNISFYAMKVFTEFESYFPVGTHIFLSA